MLCFNKIEEESDFFGNYFETNRWRCDYDQCWSFRRRITRSAKTDENPAKKPKWDNKKKQSTFTKQGCCLCDPVIELLTRYQTSHGFDIKTIDIEKDDESSYPPTPDLYECKNLILLLLN